GRRTRAKCCACTQPQDSSSPPIRTYRSLTPPATITCAPRNDDSPPEIHALPEKRSSQTPGAIRAPQRSTVWGPRFFAGEVMADQRSATAIDQHIAKRMRLRRVGIGMSQERLAQMLGISFQQVQKYEWGANRISASRLLEVSTALSMPVEHF